MITRPRLTTISQLAIPIVAGMVSSNLLTLVDTAMIGRLGPVALAAAAVCGLASGLFMAPTAGLPIAVQAIIARRMGEDKKDIIHLPVIAGLVVGLLVSIPIAVAVFILAPQIFPILNPDPMVAEVGISYMRLLAVSMPAGAIMAPLMGYWNGTGRPKAYLWITLTTHIVNVILNYLLIFGKFGLPQLGLTGAGIGSAIATYVSTGLMILITFRDPLRPQGFSRPPKPILQGVFNLMTPSSLRSVLQWAGYLLFMIFLGYVGTTEVAAAGILVRIMMVSVLPSIGLGVAAATLVGQSLGRGEPAEAKIWGWDVAKIGVVAMMILGLPMLLFPEAVLGIFINDPATIKAATAPLQLSGATRFVAVGFVFISSLNGAGDNKRVMYYTEALHWLIYLPIVWFCTYQLAWGLWGLWVVQTIHTFIRATGLAIMWQRGRWQHIKI